jgi:hypothetical protein
MAKVYFKIFTLLSSPHLRKEHGWESGHLARSFHRTKV